jgi:hypothetical protein
MEAMHMSKSLMATAALAAALGLAGCENMSSEEKGAVGGGVLGHHAGREYDERKNR